MKVTEHERRELIRLLSLRVEGYPARKATAEEAGMLDVDVRGEPEEAWARLIEQGIARRRLPALLLAAERQFPGDKALKRLAEGAKDGRIVVDLPPEHTGGGVSPATIGGLVLVIAAAAVGAWWFVPGLLHPPPPAPADGPVPVVEVRTGLQTDPKPAPRPKAAPAADPEPEPVAEPEPQPGSGKVIKVPDPQPTE